VEIGEKRLSLSLQASELLYPAEMAWAPDSSAFFIASSIGYSTGYRIEVYRVTQDKLHPMTKLSRIVQKDFEHNHRCFDVDTRVGNAPNLAGFKWLDGSQRLLVIAEVPPVGVCKEMKYFGGYEVSLRSGEIKGQFSPQQLADRWGGTLGERLRDDLQSLSADTKRKLP